MNTDLLQRATFVLDRPTAERLTAIAERLGVSRSELVRDVLGEPIDLMHKWLAMLPPDATPDQARAVLTRVGQDVEQWIDSKSAQLDLLRAEPAGHV